MKWIKEKFSNDLNIRVMGLTKELNVLYLLNLFENNNNNLLVVTNSLYECNQLYSLLSTYKEDVLLFPMDDFLSSVALAKSPDLKIKRLETLQKLKNGNNIIITNLMGYLKFLPSLKENTETEITLKIGDDINRDNLIEVLENFVCRRDTKDTTRFLCG